MIIEVNGPNDLFSRIDVYYVKMYRKSDNCRQANVNYIGKGCNHTVTIDLPATLIRRHDCGRTFSVEKMTVKDCTCCNCKGGPQ